MKDCGCNKPPTPKKEKWIRPEESPDDFIKNALAYEEQLENKDETEGFIQNVNNKHINLMKSFMGVNKDALFNKNVIIEDLPYENPEDEKEKESINVLEFISSLKNLI